jgi:hypothetical protein
MAKKQQDGEQKPAEQTVKMRRDPELNPAPHEADVHPDEVAHFRAHGWSVVE